MRSALVLPFLFLSQSGFRWSPGLAATPAGAIEKKTIPTGDEGYITLKEERTRLLRAKAELKQIEVAKRQGLLVSLLEIEREMTDLVLTTKARILNIPARLAGELVDETSLLMIQAKIEKAAEEALEPMIRHVKDRFPGCC